MSTPLVFIDGEHGTTGLQIARRLQTRRDLELIRLEEHERKSETARRRALNAADLAILCLPDAAAIQAVQLITNERTKVIDASTAHRTAPGWVYGFPEMAPGQAERIAQAGRVSNPGCYPTGAIALLRPLVEAGLVPADAPISINAVSGYTGGGKAMIAAFEDAASPDYTTAPFRLYALGLEHKHVEEIRVHARLAQRPLFAPSVGRFAQGMLVSIPLQLWALSSKPRLAALHQALREAYTGSGALEVAALEECAVLGRASSLDSRLPQPEALNDTDRLRLFTFGSDERAQALLVAQLDNLGKGASGQAIQCLDLMLGLDPTVR